MILNVHFSWAGLKIENFTKQAKKKSQNDQKKNCIKNNKMFSTLVTQKQIF